MPDSPKSDGRLEGLEAAFWRLVTTLTWLLVLALTIVSVLFILYQVAVLFLPYALAKLRNDSSYRFPEYVYRVWGQDTTDLNAEHYGYLGALVVVVGLSCAYVLPQHPFTKVKEAMIDSLLAYEAKIN